MIPQAVFDLLAYLTGTFGEIGGAIVFVVLFLVGIKVAIVVLWLLIMVVFGAIGGLAFWRTS